MVLDYTILPYTVSEKDRDQIFFRTGKYAIIDWSDEEHIRTKVEAFVYEQRKLRRDPQYDKNKENLQGYLTDISNASGEEDNILNKDDFPTSSQLENIIDKRIEVYNDLPFYVLATLIRENFCMWGDAICWQSGSLKDASILFMNSISYGFEALQYDVDEAVHITDLQKLSERYRKLGNSLPTGSDEQQYAFYLSKAFNNLVTEK